MLKQLVIEYVTCSSTAAAVDRRGPIFIAGQEQQQQRELTWFRSFFLRQSRWRHGRDRESWWRQTAELHIDDMRVGTRIVLQARGLPIRCNVPFMHGVCVSVCGNKGRSSPRFGLKPRHYYPHC